MSFYIVNFISPKLGYCKVVHKIGQSKLSQTYVVLSSVITSVI